MARAPLPMGWLQQGDRLSVAPCTGGGFSWATVYRSHVTERFMWRAGIEPRYKSGETDNLADARSAAEDAARSLVDEMAAALGGRVVWGECSSLCAPGERCMVTDSGRCQAETAATAAAGEGR